jgi:hypothetical protein
VTYRRLRDGGHQDGTELVHDYMYPTSEAVMEWSVAIVEGRPRRN